MILAVEILNPFYPQNKLICRRQALGGSSQAFAGEQVLRWGGGTVKGEAGGRRLFRVFRDK